MTRERQRRAKYMCVCVSKRGRKRGERGDTHLEGTSASAKG